MKAARIPPIIGVPSNSLEADRPTKIFNPQKAVLPATEASWNQAVTARFGSTLAMPFKIPVNKPQAIKAGMRGVKMREIFRKPSLKGVAFFLRIRVCKSSPPVIGEGDEAIVISSFFIISLRASVTLEALPGPRITCHSAPEMWTPFTSSKDSKDSFVKSSLVTVKRRRVIQW